MKIQYLLTGYQILQLSHLTENSSFIIQVKLKLQTGRNSEFSLMIQLIQTF